MNETSRILHQLVSRPYMKVCLIPVLSELSTARELRDENGVQDLLLRSAPTNEKAITQLSDDRLCQA